MLQRREAKVLNGDMNTASLSSTLADGSVEGYEKGAARKMENISSSAVKWMYRRTSGCSGTIRQKRYAHASTPKALIITCDLDHVTVHKGTECNAVFDWQVDPSSVRSVEPQRTKVRFDQIRARPKTRVLVHSYGTIL
nr:hypothetical protein CFP56_76502 [Quercus suber]